MEQRHNKARRYIRYRRNKKKLDDYRNIYDYKSSRSGECYIGMKTEENETICNKTEEKSTNSIPEYEQNVNSVHEFKLATPKNMLYSCVDLYPVGLNELMKKPDYHCRK